MGTQMQNADANDYEPAHKAFTLDKYTSDYEIGRQAAVESLIPNGNGHPAVDIACGPGFYSRMLSGKGWRVTGIDTDEQNIRNAGAFTVDTRVGDAKSVLEAMPEESFDLALVLEIIEHMPKGIGRKLLQATRRVLRPGGQLILSTPNRHSIEGLGNYYWGEKLRNWGQWDAWDDTHVHIYSTPEIRLLLRETGFAIDRMVGYHYAGPLPLIGQMKLPFRTTRHFPLNRFGFNTLLRCRVR